MTFFRALLVFALGCSSMLAAAGEFRSVASPAVLYDAPSTRSKKLFIAPTGMPVEVVVNFDSNWSKVRDAQGDIVWIERKLLALKRTLMALRNTTAYKEASDASGTAFQIEQGVLLDWQEAPAKDWLRIKHADGSTGFVKTADVWGW